MHTKPNLAMFSVTSWS